MAGAEPNGAQTSARTHKRGYESLTAAEVVRTVPRLSSDALVRLRRYEAAHKARSTVLNAVDDLLAGRVDEVDPAKDTAAEDIAAPVPAGSASAEARGEGGEPYKITAGIDPSTGIPIPTASTWTPPADSWEPTKEPVTEANPLERARLALSGKPWPRIVVPAAIALVLLIIGVAAGKSGTVTSSKYDALRAELARTHDEVTQANQRAADAEAKAQADAQSKIDNARAQDQTQLQQQQATLAKQQADAQAAQAAAQDQSQQNAAQKSALDQQQAVTDANSFSDGLYQVGRDIRAGRYHTNGGTSCYWAKLSSSDTSSYIDNNLQSGPQTVTIDSPYFKSDGCGTWTKVG